MTSRKNQQKLVDQWNGQHQPGTSVSVRLDSGETRLTKTRSEAIVSSSGHAVIWLEGITGYYLLERVSATIEGGKNDQQ